MEENNEKSDSFGFKKDDIIKGTEETEKHEEVKIESYKEEPKKEDSFFEEKMDEERKPEDKMDEERKPVKVNKLRLWQFFSAVLAILLIASIYTGGFKGDGSPEGIVPSVDGLTAIIVSDERCETCNTAGIISQLKTTFPDLKIVEFDYNSVEGKGVYDDAELTTLPAVLFTEAVKTDANYAQIESYLEDKGDYLNLKIGSSFNPEAEICDNDKDDNDDGKVDCADETCKGEFACMEKQEVPEVEAFVMSHCPYGTQIVKGLIPVMELLEDKADISIKFVNYAMHGEKELDEQLNQYCIQEEQNDLFLDYLKCFLKEDKGAECLDEVGVDKTKLVTCVGITDAKFKVTENFEDKATWMGNFPPFNVFDDENQEYGVRGSPTLVVNGVTASAGRDSASLLKAVCTGFKTEPDECGEELSAVAPSPGFGFETTGAAATAATCG